jgi:23S rRNA pseudouridine1911/1915/1917 synthase
MKHYYEHSAQLGCENNDMAKHIDTDILALLRRFEIAGELSSKKSIKDIKEYPERQLSKLIGFTFERTRYFLLTDSSVKDSFPEILAHIQQDVPNIVGRLVQSPLDTSLAYGMPHKGKDVYLFAVVSPKVRLDLELVRRYPELSRSTIQKYIKSGFVQVNGEVITQQKSDVTEDDDIAMTPPLKESHDESELPILYLDDNVIVVNKPTGVLTHSKGVMNLEFTVADFFRRYTTFGLETNRPGIVHRLDRDTSGIIIGARNEEAAELLKKQFADRTTKKEYRAVVDGTIKQEKALIDLPIGRHPSAPSTFRVDPSGKPAQTVFEVLSVADGLALVKLLPRTGRTHQLRVHMQYINAPILGDRVYGTKRKADRLYLHAHSLEITIPDAKRTTFTAPIPESFAQLFPDYEK